MINTYQNTVINNKINDMLQEYGLNIEPELLKNQQILSEYVKYKILLQDKEHLNNLIKKYTQDMNNIENIVPTEQKKAPNLKLKDILSNEDTKNKISSLEEEIKKLIIDWGILDLNNQNDSTNVCVAFDIDTCDIKINDRSRNTYGKGIRAILYTAFLVGFLNYCIKNNLQHPGFVVIDSPLTTYKKNKNEKNDDLNKNVHNRFYNSIKQLTNEQIILFENLDKYPENTNNINIIELEHGLFPIEN